MAITVRQMRLMHEATQEECAKLLDITPVAYRNKELGETRFYLDEVAKLCKHFGVDISDIKVD